MAALAEEVSAALDAALDDAQRSGRDVTDAAQAAAGAVAAFTGALQRCAGADVAVVRDPGQSWRHCRARAGQVAHESWLRAAACSGQQGFQACLALSSLAPLGPAQAMDDNRAAADRAVIALRRATGTHLSTLDESLRSLRAFVEASRASTVPALSYGPPRVTASLPAPTTHAPVARQDLSASLGSPTRVHALTASPRRALALSPTRMGASGDAAAVLRENRALAEALRAAQRRVEDATKRETEAAEAGEVGARALRSAAEALRAERDAARESAAAGAARAEALEERLREAREALDDARREVAAARQRGEDVARAAEAEAEAYTSQLHALKERVSQVWTGVAGQGSWAVTLTSRQADVLRAGVVEAHSSWHAPAGVS